MYCWKSIDMRKDFGQQWLAFVSALIGLLVFSVMYIPLSMYHASEPLNEVGILYLTVSLLLLPAMHTSMHILPLWFMHKQIRLGWRKNRKLPRFHYHIAVYLTKGPSLAAQAAPTLFITIPGLIASWLFPEYYVYFLLFTSVHISISLQDFISFAYMIRAPKKAFIDNGMDGFDILIKS